MNPLATWLRFDPSGEWSRTIGPVCLRTLMEFGFRQVWDEDRFDINPMTVVPEDAEHNFLLDERASEEGWAIENQVSMSSRLVVRLYPPSRTFLTGNRRLKAEG